MEGVGPSAAAAVVAAAVDLQLYNMMLGNKSNSLFLAQQRLGSARASPSLISVFADCMKKSKVLG